VQTISGNADTRGALGVAGAGQRLGLQLRGQERREHAGTPLLAVDRARRSQRLGLQTDRGAPVPEGATGHRAIDLGAAALTVRLADDVF
jgi:hypothetical protein